MSAISQYPNGAHLASQEEDLDCSEEDITPTGSMVSIGGGSVKSRSSLASYKSALSNHNDSHGGSIGSFQSIGNESFSSISTSRSFKSARSCIDADFGSSSSHSHSMRSLGAESFKSCSTYASFKSARSRTDSENSNDLTPTNSLQSFIGGSIDSFQSFKSARSGTTYTGDEPGDLCGSIGSLGSFASFKTFASFKNAKSDLSLSETITGDNDFASLHRFCTDSSMETSINNDHDIIESDDEDEETLLDIYSEKTTNEIENIDTTLSHDCSLDIPESANITVTLPDGEVFRCRRGCLPNPRVSENLAVSSNSISR